MRLVRYNVAVSLDGYIAPPDGSADWIVHDPEIDFVALFAEFDTFVLGRKTYEFMLSQGQDNNPLRGRPRDSVVVVSSRLRAEDHPEVTVVGSGAGAGDDDFLDHVRKLKEEGEEGKDIWLFGGGELAGPCFDAGLVDSVETAIVPVLLRDGVKLVTGGDFLGRNARMMIRLELESLRRLEKSGILMCRYRVNHGG